MRFKALFFLLILCSLSLASAQVSYDDCCLKYVKRFHNLIQKHAVNYRRQETDGGCNIPAIIITLRRGRQFCTDPKEKWVSELMEKIDKKHDKKRQEHIQQPYRG